MKKYAWIQNGRVGEIIVPPVAEGAFFGERTEAEGPLVVAGAQYPIELCYTSQFVDECVEVPGGASVAVGDSWSEAAGFGPPPPAPPAPPMTAAEAKARRDTLLTSANLRKGALQDAADIGEATPEELALLTAWKQHTTALTRVEQQAGFPAAVEWPAAPE